MSAYDLGVVIAVVTLRRTHMQSAFQEHFTAFIDQRNSAMSILERIPRLRTTAIWGVLFKMCRGSKVRPDIGMARALDGKPLVDVAIFLEKGEESRI